MVAFLVPFIVTTVGARLVPDEVVYSRTALVWYQKRAVHEYSLTRSVLTTAQGLFSESISVIRRNSMSRGDLLLETEQGKHATGD